MRTRAIAIAVLLIIVVWVGRRDDMEGRMSVEKREAPFVVSLDNGRFSPVSRRDQQGEYEWIVYHDNYTGSLVDLLINYGATQRHNSIGCSWLSGEFPSWHQLVSVKDHRSSTAVFDVAIFPEATGRLEASTECWASGCTEEPFTPVRGWIWRPLVVEKPPVPVAIGIQSATFGDDSTALLGILKTFLGTLDLAPVLKSAAIR
jgi:hypothetical protein